LVGRATVRRVLIAGLLIVVLLVFLFPYAYMVSTSFKTPGQTLAVPPTLLPKTWSIQSYLRLGQGSGIARAFVNSIGIAVVSTLLALLLGVPAAYAVTRYGTAPGRVFLVFALVTRMVPAVTLGIPLFTIMSTLGLLDTWVAVAVAHTTISLPLAVWLLAGFFEAVPFELEEAARVDGCSRLGALWRVIIPVVTGGIAVTSIFSFLASWNEFLFALLLTSNSAQTVPVAINAFNTQYGLDWGTMTSLSVVYSLPVIALSLFMQRRIIAGMTLGAVKG
jgi:multiple sugar transport system permease protein